jgi:hypothetical protein
MDFVREIARVEYEGTQMAEALLDSDDADEIEDFKQDYMDALRNLYDEIGRVPQDLEELVEIDAREIEAYADSVLDYKFAVNGRGGSNFINLQVGGSGQ